MSQPPRPSTVPVPPPRVTVAAGSRVSFHEESLFASPVPPVFTGRAVFPVESMRIYLSAHATGFVLRSLDGGTSEHFGEELYRIVGSSDPLGLTCLATNFAPVRSQPGVSPRTLSLWEMTSTNKATCSNCKLQGERRLFLLPRALRLTQLSCNEIQSVRIPNGLGLIRLPQRNSKFKYTTAFPAVGEADISLRSSHPNCSFTARRSDQQRRQGG